MNPISGIYHNENVSVAVKITWNNQSAERERAALSASNALVDGDIERRGIARIYYNGSFLKKYYAFAMTLFDETVQSRFTTQRNHFSTLSVLIIFKRTVSASHEFSLNYNFISGTKTFLKFRLKY